MVTSGASGQNVEVDRASPRDVGRALCDERPAGGSNPAALDQYYVAPLNLPDAP